MWMIPRHMDEYDEPVPELPRGNGCWVLIAAMLIGYALGAIAGVVWFGN